MLRVSSLSRALELTSLSDVSSRIMDSFSSLDVFLEVENVGNRLRRFACFEVEPPPLEEVSGLPPPPSSCCNDLRCSVGASNMEIGRALPELAGLRTEGSRLGDAILNACMRRSGLRVCVVSSYIESSVKYETRRLLTLDSPFGSRVQGYGGPCTTILSIWLLVCMAVGKQEHASYIDTMFPSIVHSSIACFDTRQLFPRFGQLSLRGHVDYCQVQHIFSQDPTNQTTRAASPLLTISTSFTTSRSVFCLLRRTFTILTSVFARACAGTALARLRRIRGLVGLSFRGIASIMSFTVGSGSSAQQASDWTTSCSFKTGSRAQLLMIFITVTSCTPSFMPGRSAALDPTCVSFEMAFPPAFSPIHSRCQFAAGSEGYQPTRVHRMIRIC